MSELMMIQRLKERILPKLPPAARSSIELELKRTEDEWSIHRDILSCAACPLQETCTNKVPGVGPTDSPIMLIGESPGEMEDKEGLPFVGRGGELLSRALEAVGWNREELYITNLLKCYPEGNRTPSTQEVAACYQHLKKEIELVRPKVIITLGSLSANTLIHPDFKITQENGHWFELPSGSRAVAVYHPSYILRLGEGTQRQIHAKWEMFNALKKVREYQQAGFEDAYQ